MISVCATHTRTHSLLVFHLVLHTVVHRFGVSLLSFFRYLFVPFFPILLMVLMLLQSQYYVWFCFLFLEIVVALEIPGLLYHFIHPILLRSVTVQCCYCSWCCCFFARTYGRINADERRENIARASTHNNEPNETDL